jgi:NAD(P)-dependent dehydrogenase (short-subunit alcohol dehydrogenase family)
MVAFRSRESTPFRGAKGDSKISRMGQLSGQVALVTGASRGIGKAIALALAGEGASLLLTARSAEVLAETAREATAVASAVDAQARAMAFPADVTDEGQVDALFACIRNEWGRLDLVVNNAGAFDGGPLEELSLETWEKVISTNLRGPFLCTRGALRIMKPQQRGRIINIGSIAGQRVRPGSAPYATSKHGLWGLTQATALEGREYGVTCCCLHPGNVLVERRQASGKMEDDEPMIAAEDLARVALLMATLPPHVEMLEAIVLPMAQKYVGRG